MSLKHKPASLKAARRRKGARNKHKAAVQRKQHRNQLRIRRRGVGK